MKTAFKNSMIKEFGLAVTCLVVGAAFYAGPVLAQAATGTGFVPPAAPSMPTPAAAPAVSAPALPPTAELPKPEAPIEVTPAAPAMPARPNKPAKPLEAADIKPPESVRDAIKKLDSSENVTLDDLNSARQAIARIDVLIEIEKKLGELEKLRQEREADAKPLSAAIPATAISALPVPAPPPSFSPPSFPAVPSSAFGNNNNNNNNNPIPVAAISSSSGGDISRIIGSGGHYVAVVKNGDQDRYFKVGDHFDGGTITGITPTSVELEQGKSSRTLHVKNIDNVFGAP